MGETVTHSAPTLYSRLKKGFNQKTQFRYQLKRILQSGINIVIIQIIHINKYIHTYITWAIYSKRNLFYNSIFFWSLFFINKYLTLLSKLKMMQKVKKAGKQGSTPCLKVYPSWKNEYILHNLNNYSVINHKEVP